MNGSRSASRRRAPQRDALPMGPSTLMDQARDAACGDSYAALYEGCRSPEIEAWPVTAQASALSRLASQFALCARGAQLRPARVLDDLRLALQPLERRPG